MSKMKEQFITDRERWARRDEFADADTLDALIAERSEAFAPATLPGLADEWHRLNIGIGALRKQRDHIEQILLEASAKDHNGKSEEWREGALIEGVEVNVRAVWRLTQGAPHVTWAPKLEYVR